MKKIKERLKNITSGDLVKIIVAVTTGLQGAYFYSSGKYGLTQLLVIYMFVNLVVTLGVNKIEKRYS